MGQVPKDWETSKIANLFDVETGTTPSTRVEDYWKDGKINWITPTDLSRLESNIYVSQSERKISENAARVASLKPIPKGSIILSTRAPVGYTAVLQVSSTFNQGCKSLIPKNISDVCPEFYCYFLLNSKKRLEALSSGATFLELSKYRLESLVVPKPQIMEQRNIAQVLLKIDGAIQKTYEMIAKSQDLRKGLFQELLTKGIGHREFKETEVGKIPKSWELFSLGELLTICQYGLSLPLLEKGQYPIVRMNEIYDGYVISNVEKFVDLDEKLFAKFKLEDGDVLFNRTNSFELVGRSGLFELAGDYVFASYLIRLRPNKETLDSHYLTYQLIFSRDRIVKYASKAVHQANINATNLRKITIPVPPLEEQKRICETLRSMDSTIRIEREELSGLEIVKQGFMDLLLTGKVRIRAN